MPSNSNSKRPMVVPREPMPATPEPAAVKKRPGVTMETQREGDRRRALEAIKRGADYLQTPAGGGRMDARNVLSARGGAAGGGGGEGGGGGGPEMPAPGVGAVQAALRARLTAPAPDPTPAPAPALKAQASMQGAQPYREADGPRVFSAAPAPQSNLQQALANQLLSRVSTTGYSPGVLATRERQRAQQELAGLNLSPAAHSAALARIQQGDTGVVSRAAQLMSQIPPSAMNRGPVAQYVAEQLKGGDGAQQFDAARQADLAHYRQVAQRNTDSARANSAKAVEMGMDPLSSASQLQAELRRRLQESYRSADLPSLQKLAAAGDVDAARAIEGTPGPWAPGDPNLGVRRNTQAREDSVLQQRYLAPAQTRAETAAATARIQQETARMREAGLDRRALMKVNPLTGQPETLSADQVLRTYQTALKSYEHANGSLDGFPNFFDWANTQGFKLAPQVGQAALPAPAMPSPSGGPPVDPQFAQIAPEDRALLDGVPPKQRESQAQALEANGHPVAAAYLRSR